MEIELKYVVSIFRWDQQQIGYYRTEINGFE